jgi:uncharacterized protein YndB with AHSA1/START domain
VHDEAHIVKITHPFFGRLVPVSPRAMIRVRAVVGGFALLQAGVLAAGDPIGPRLRPRPATEQPMGMRSGDTTQATKGSDRETVVTATFRVPRPALFEALTRPAHLKQWMRAAGMTLAEAEVEGRAGGSFRFVFQRPSGRKIEVHGAYRTFDPPRGFSYLETYDFSPLRIDVTTGLEDAGDETRFTQTLRYASAQERDEDFEPVASSSREAYTRLAQYLGSRAP